MSGSTPTTDACVCDCGGTFTAAAFAKLATIGVFGSARGSQGPWRAVEVRRCSLCESPLARSITLRDARLPVDPEATDENPLHLRRAFAGIDDDYGDE